MPHRSEYAYRREQGDTGLFDGAWFARQDRPYARQGNSRGAAPLGRPLCRELEEIPHGLETDRLMRPASFLLIFIFTFALVGCDEDDLRRAVIETKSGAVHTFVIELALTPEEQQKGLMFRTELPENAGMLFFHRACVPAAFWMKNTLLPLDMIFIAADGRIARIAEMTEP